MKKVLAQNPLVSIVIPTYNEEKDIERTLRACMGIDYENKEIIVVDDSTDSTPDIVRGFEKDGVKLVHRAVNDGKRCGARNRGIEESRGEILVLLNADTILPKHFIKRILPHYYDGTGFLLVKSEVLNKHKAIPRFIDSSEKANHEGDLDWVYWTEGFSCLKQAAVEIGMFPVPAMPLTAGEDGFFGAKMLEAGYRRTTDHSIVVQHYAPETVIEFWQNHKTRVSSITSYFLDQRGIGEIFVRTLARSFVFFVSAITIIPYLVKGHRVSLRSERGLRDIVLFALIHFLQDGIFLFGKWQSFFQLIRWRYG